MARGAEDRLLLQTRVVAAILVPVLGSAFVLLWAFPTRTEDLFAWTIKPPMTPMFMGAGYGAGAYFWSRVVFLRQWHRMTAIFVPTTAFTWLSGAATVIHWDRFNHDHPTFWIWTAVYFVTPLLVPLTYVLNRRQAPAVEVDADDVLMPRLLRSFMASAGLAGLLLALQMFVSPSTVIPRFPWTLTPLTARVIAAWLAFFGLSWLTLARDPRWSAWRLVMEGSTIALALMLVGVLRDWNSFDASSVATWLYLAGAATYLAVLLYCFSFAARATSRLATA